MEIDEPHSNLSDQITVKFSINVLQLLKSAQMQHGLRHGDYTRYRRYCTSRLRRLYKVLKFTHGRGKYVRRSITESTVTEARFLQLVLCMAERAWSHAMEKKQLPDGPNARQRIFLIRRLRKAVKWAALFSRLCTSKGDTRTSLEAEAYASYMKGSLLFERERSWDIALTNFKHARAVYKELGKLGDVENQVLCRERVEELEPSIRYCLHKIGEANLQTSELLYVDEMEGPVFDVFKAKLAAVVSEARSQQAASMSEFPWLGRRYPISNAKVRVLVLKAQELGRGVNGSVEESLATEKRLAIYDKMLNAYHEARNHIRNDLVATADTGNVKDELYGLDKAIGAALAECTIERNQLLVSIAKKKDGKPKELVRVYDLLIQTTSDLRDLVSSWRERNLEETTYSEVCYVKNMAFRSERCFYLAKTYSLAGKRAEAYALYGRARSLADAAVENIKHLDNQDQLMIDRLQALSLNCRSSGCIEHAKAVLDEEKASENLSKRISAVSLSETERKVEKLLMENLDVYESAVGDANAKCVPRIEVFPPAPKSVPRSPVVLDLAYDFVEFPSLLHRMRKDKKGFISRLWR